MYLGLDIGTSSVKAVLIDGEGQTLQEVTPADGAIPLEFSAGEAFRVRAEWE